MRKNWKNQLKLFKKQYKEGVYYSDLATTTYIIKIHHYEIMIKQEEERKEKNKKGFAYLLDRFVFILIALVLIFLAANQFMALYHKEILVLSPCQVCAKANPKLDECFGNVLIQVIDPITKKPLTEQEIKKIYELNISSLEDLIIRTYPNQTINDSDNVSEHFITGL